MTEAGTAGNSGRTHQGDGGRGASSSVVALVVAAAWFIQNLDTTIVATSLPQMARTFGVGAASVNIGITAYVVAGAAFIPLGGWMADRYGARSVLASAIAVFGLASVGCALSTGLWQFVAFRVVQGIGAALMMPVGRLVVLRNAPKDELLRATALITWPALIAPVIGPVLGGALTTWYGWEWNFLINVPLTLIGSVLVLLYVPNHKNSSPKPLDLTGSVLLVASLSLSIYGLSRLAHSALPGLDLSITAAGAVLGAAAVWWFRRTPRPLIDLRPLAVTTFSVSTLYAGNLIRLAICATPFLLPLMLQESWRLSALDAGKVVLVYSLGNLVMKTVTTPLLRLFGFRPVLVGNGIAVAASLAACGLLTAQTDGLVVNAVAFVAGAARSLQFTGINTLTFADIDPGDQASASTFFSMMQQVSMALGVAAAAIVLEVSRGTASTPLTQGDFALAFWVTASIALLGALLMLRLPRDAGHVVTGHAARDSKA